MTSRTHIGILVAIMLAAGVQAQQGLTLRYYTFGGNPSTSLFDPVTNLLALTPYYTSPSSSECFGARRAKVVEMPTFIG